MIAENEPDPIDASLVKIRSVDRSSTLCVQTPIKRTQGFVHESHMAVQNARAQILVFLIIFGEKIGSMNLS